MYTGEQMELDPQFADYPTDYQLGIDNDHEAYIGLMDTEEYQDSVNWWAA